MRDKRGAIAPVRDLGLEAYPEKNLEVILGPRTPLGPVQNFKDRAWLLKEASIHGSQRHCRPLHV